MVHRLHFVRSSNQQVSLNTTILIAILAVIFGLGLHGCGGYNQPPNVILIVVDTLRADHLGCYDYRHNTSPNIDQFAQNALLFEYCFAHAPETKSSCASIISGFLPHETRVLANRVLSPDVDTLAEILQSQGYDTAAVISNYVLRKGRGFEQGFALYDDTMDDRELVRNWPERIAEGTTSRAIELLKQNRDKPLFMWIHYQDPHGPYTPPNNFTKEFENPSHQPKLLRVNRSVSGQGGIPSYQKLGSNTDYHYYASRYDGEIRYLDNEINRLFDTLKQQGFYDNALIVFTSDHGEGMGEHNYYFSHNESLYNGQIHVPLMIRYGKQFKGRRNDFVQHIDLVPTILNILEMTPNPRLRGRDLLNHAMANSPILSEMPTAQAGFKFSLVQGKHKFIYNQQSKIHELFNLSTDPGEQADLIRDGAHQERSQNMAIEMRRILDEDRLKVRLNIQHGELTEEEKSKLRALGYSQ